MIDIPTIQHPRGRQPSNADLRKLEEALERYGYHCYRPQYYYDNNGNLMSFDEMIDCQLLRPYYSYSEIDSLVIVHSTCNIPGHEHEQAFLQAMIPIIGKLDALAYYEPGEKYKLGPRLRIYL